MIIITLTIIIFFNTTTCSAELWFFNKVKRMFGNHAKDKTVKGAFRTVSYLGSVTKIHCFGKNKYPIQNFRRLSWYHSGRRLSNSDHYQINKYGTLTINGVTVEDSGEFVCLMNSKPGIYKFKHDVNVIQFPSRSLHIRFIYTVRLCSPKSEDFAARFIESKVQGKVCVENECKVGYIHSSCYFEKFASPRIKVTVPLILPGIPNGSCNIQCLREKQDYLKEAVKKKVISAVMQGSRLKIREEPREISISYLETEENNICDPGFEMKGSMARSLCFPCSPGHFMEKGYCIPCHLNHYNGKYASTECQACFGSRKTRSRGAISEEDCYLADPDMLWILFAIFMIVTSLILLCCCWSILKCLGISVGKCVDAICCYNFLNQGKVLHSHKDKDKNQPKRVSGSREKSKHPLNEASPKRRLRASESSFVIPSVRHSTGKDFLYKPLRRVVKKIIPPPPPPLPTDSMLNEVTKNMAYHTVASMKKSETRKAENKTSDRSEENKVTDISSEERIVPQYRERFKKNKPMYNAYMKSKV